jgi:hypothetical protein
MASDNDDASIFSITPMDLIESSILYKEAIMNSIESSEDTGIPMEILNLEDKYDGFL